ncbi:MAG: ABC transporter ATP-binding protein [Muribaculaceae bacterium]|nr:ABC transporter ATP-binding protein [Muribaculaceae bacterium]
MISLKNVSYRYSGSKRNSISNFSMELSFGKIVGLLGANGAGKSTLLYLISGLLKATEGSVNVNDFNPWDRCPEFLSRIFLVPEEIDVPSISLESYVKAYAPFYPNFSHESLKEALSHFNLSPEIHLGSLSMGQRKKAFLAFALACHTPVLLMDEPTNGLDIPGKSEFRKAVVKTMNDERTIIISTHQVRDLDQLLDHVTIMDNNGIQLDESISALQERFTFGLAPVLPEHGVIWSEPVMGGHAFMKMRTPDQPETEVNLEALFNYIYSRSDYAKNN